MMPTVLAPQERDVNSRAAQLSRPSYASASTRLWFPSRVPVWPKPERDERAVATSCVGEIDSSYKVAKKVGEFSVCILRERLRPTYGDGFQGAPLTCPVFSQKQGGLHEAPEIATPGGASGV